MNEEPTATPADDQAAVPDSEPTPPAGQPVQEASGGPSQPYPGYWYGPPAWPWPVPPGYGQGYGAPPWQAPPPPYAVAPSGTPAPSKAPRRRLGSILGRVTVAWVVAGLLALTVAGLAAALATTNSGPSPVAFRTPFGFGPNAPGQFGPNAPGQFGQSVPGKSGPNGPGQFGQNGPGQFGQNGPGQFGQNGPGQFGQSDPGQAGPGGQGPGIFGRLGSAAVVGSVASVDTNSFTVSSRSGQTVTVQEQSSTVYYSGLTEASASVVVQGARVVVQRTRSANTVTATSVTVLPAGRFGPGPANS